jgi:hypothetical protein
MGPHDDGDRAHEELTIDVGFEDDLRDVEASVAAYLDRPDDDHRAALVASLERLDAQIARSESFDSNSSVGFAFGSAPRIAIIGETTDNPVVEPILPAEFQFQVTLVRAAKDEVREPSPRALEALRVASAELSEYRSHGSSVPD